VLSRPSTENPSPNQVEGCLVLTLTPFGALLLGCLSARVSLYVEHEEHFCLGDRLTILAANATIHISRLSA
jgi:hypothetical protein